MFLMRCDFIYSKTIFATISSIMSIVITMEVLGKISTMYGNFNSCAKHVYLQIPCAQHMFISVWCFNGISCKFPRALLCYSKNVLLFFLVSVFVWLTYYSSII